MTDWQTKAERAWTRAHQSHWLCAMIAGYRKIATWQSLPPSELSRLRGAWIFYAFLRTQKPQDARKLRFLRKRHDYRRWYEISLLWREFEFEPDLCIEYLEFEGGIEAMRMQVIDIHHPDPEWRRKFDSMCKYGDVIFTSYDAPEDVRAWAGEGKRLMEKYK
jgi:hypothetical protein